MDGKPGSVPVRGCPRAGEDHSSRRRIAASLEHSHPDVGAPHDARSLGRAVQCDVPIRACSGRGLPRRRSPGCRAWALTPRFHPYLCLARRSSQRRWGHRPSAVWFLLRFPSGCPGSPLTTSLPCGARTFLPRAIPAHRRSSLHLQPKPDYPAGARSATPSPPAQAGLACVHEGRCLRRARRRVGPPDR